MHFIQQILFILLLVGGIGLFALQVRRIRRNIFLGKAKKINDHAGERWKNMLLLAMGQKKMFKKPLPAILHLFVYVGFVIINIEIFEIVLDGITGHHRLFAPALGSLYTLLINGFEFLALSVLIACVIFLIRRNVVKVKRLNQNELNGWPRSDANLILCTEIVLMTLFLCMNGADQILQSRGVIHYTPTDSFKISGVLSNAFVGLSNDTLVGIERCCWWLHIIGIFAFLNYLPISKHFHILLAFPNAYYGRLEPKGEMDNMPAIQKEVLMMMQPESVAADESSTQGAPQRFGAKDVFDLSWKNLLDAYSCTECGRCTAECPANITGKKLSPRKIMMDTRDRLESVGKNIDKHKSFVDDGKTLLHDYITVEELRACTTCNACVEACPVSIEPLDIIVQMRRYLVMEESNSPQEWNMMFGNIENNMAPWKFSPEERTAWIKE